MPTQIYNIFVPAITVTTTNTTSSYFYTVPTDTTVDDTTPYLIPVASFNTDAGVAATAFPIDVTDESYYNLYINGVKQQTGAYDVTPGSTGTGQLSIAPTTTTPYTILAGTPVIVEYVSVSTVTS